MGSFVDSLARPEIFALKPYVPGKPIEEVERELGLTGVIKLASNENPLGPSPLAMARVREAIPKLNLYPDGTCFYLRQALSRSYGFGTDHFLLGNGSDELLRYIAETFVCPGDEVVMGYPTFVEYEFMTLIMGGKCIVVPLKDTRFDLPAMKKAINERTKIVYICNPNNPTGSVVSRQEIDQFMDGLPEGLVVVFDEAYFEYASDEATVSGIDYVSQGRNVIVLRTFSKVYGLAGLRLGYGITTPDIAALVKRVSEPFNVNSLAQIAGIAALEDVDFLKLSREMNQRGRDYLGGQFTGMGMNFVSSQANFILVDLGRDCIPVYNDLMKAGIIVRSGAAYGFPTHIRVTIGTTGENERFIRELKKIIEE